MFDCRGLHSCIILSVTTDLHKQIKLKLIAEIPYLYDRVTSFRAIKHKSKSRVIKLFILLISSNQFWAAYVPCDAQHRDAVQLTFEQIDLIQRLTDKYHPQLTFCTSADGKSINIISIVFIVWDKLRPMFFLRTKVN